jgi:hypothetical protein
MYGPESLNENPGISTLTYPFHEIQSHTRSDIEHEIIIHTSITIVQLNHAKAQDNNDSRHPRFQTHYKSISIILYLTSHHITSHSLKPTHPHTTYLISQFKHTHT